MEPVADRRPAPMVADTLEMPAALAQPAAVFTPTHEVPAGGMSAWAAPDPNLQPVARLEARVQLRVDERRGAWARVTGQQRLDAAGWTTGAWSPSAAPPQWRRPRSTPRRPTPRRPTPRPAYTTAPMAVTSPQPAVFAPTHQVPSGGMQASLHFQSNLN